MDDFRAYRIQVRGQVEADAIREYGPSGLSVEQAEPGSTLLAACTDQSGLMGLLRRLHSLGLVLVSVRCDAAERTETFPPQPS